MDTQPISNGCPKCHAPLPADAPQGLCPKCLLAAVATPTEAGQPAGRPTPPAVADIAAAFPQLEILEFIGQGGMGFVFKARQPKLDRLVALKILPQSLAADPTFAERFHREAKLLARLNHPGIVTVHDFGSVEIKAGAGAFDLEEEKRRKGEKGREASEAEVSSSPSPLFPSSIGQTQAFSETPARLYYLLMEFVDGVNLRQAMLAGRFTPDQALAIVPKICEALQFAHNEGILHRDIKPENILLDAKGRVKIADFGIAKLVGTEAPLTPSLSPSDGERVADRPGEGLPHVALTEAGKALGTPNYMAPEQLENAGDVDHRADIYSLGVVFYEMLTGELPRGRFAPPSQKSAADPRVDEVVLRALEKEKSRRFASAEEVRTQVETLTTSQNNPAGLRSSPKTKMLGKVSDWRTWSPFQSAELKEICAHMTDAERNETARRGAVMGVWLFVVPFLVMFAGIQSGRPGVLVLMVVVLAVFYLAFILITQHRNRLFICSTEWARARGYTPDKLRLFAFTRSSRREEAQTSQTPDAKSQVLSSQSRLTSAATTQESRFSRMAIVGACWALFGVLHLFFPTLGYRMKSEFVPIMMSILGLSALLGTTILGWVAVVQIRRSAGKLKGLGLATFDGLVFPLLAINGLIVLGADALTKSLGSRLIPHWGHFGFTLFLGVSAMVCCIGLTLFIIRRVWRAVNKGVAAAPTAGAALRNSFRKPMITGGAVLVVALLAVASLNYASRRAAEQRQQTRGALQIELGNKIAALLGDERRITYSSLTFVRGRKEATWEAVVNFTGLQSWRSPSNEPLGHPRKIQGSIVLDYQPPNEWTASGTGDLYGLGATWHTTTPGFPEWPEAERPGAGVSVAVLPTRSFGPVVERALRFDEHGSAGWLDLDSGKYHHEDFPSASITATTNGGLAASHLVVIQSVRREQWETLTAEQVKQALDNTSFSGFTYDAGSSEGLPKVWLFKTFHGAMGLLQITGFTDNPRGVKILYKLVQAAGSPRAAKPEAAVVPATASMMTYGPVLERIVNDIRTTTANTLLDLETGTIFSLPDDLAAMQKTNATLASTAVKAWLTDHDVDAAGDVDWTSVPIRRGLGSDAAMGLFATEVDNDYWESISPASVGDKIAAAKADYRGGRNAFGGPGLPTTFAFETRRGNTGLLQITGFTENPRGVKLRYKLVQIGSQPKAQTDASTNAQASAASAETHGPNRDYFLLYAWDVSYNLTTNVAALDSRWQLLLSAISKLRDEGLKEFPDDAQLHRELAWLFQHRIGRLGKIGTEPSLGGVTGFRRDGDLETDPDQIYFRYQWFKLVEQAQAKGQSEQRLKLDPALMKSVDAQYGPLDWRLPESHAIYWCSKRLMSKPVIKTEDVVMLQRILYQSLQASYHHGKVVGQPTPTDIRLERNLDLVPKVDASYEHQLAAAIADPGPKASLQNAQRNFLCDAVVALHEAGREAESRAWFDRLCKIAEKHPLLFDDPQSFPGTLTCEEFVKRSKAPSP